jgi:PsbP-like protein
MKRLLLILFIMLASVAGCGPWQTTGGLYTSSWNDFTVELPEGWVRENRNDYIRMTRDGFLLQSIYIGRTRVDEFELQYTKKKLTKGMLPQEVAEVLLDNMASNPAMNNLEVKENKPTKISGKRAAKIIVLYKNKDGLKLKTISYRLVMDEWLYTISYTAPLRYYFDRDVKAFEKIVTHFQLHGTA